jgi:hypothetical protein
MPLHTMMVGPPACGKSRMAEMHRLAMMANQQKSRGHASDKAQYTNAFTGGTVEYSDEAPPLLTDETAKFQRQHLGELSRLKQEYSEGKRNFERYLAVENGPAKKHEVEKDLNVCRMMSANKNEREPGGDSAMATRVDLVVIIPDADDHVKMIDRVTDPLADTVRPARFALVCEGLIEEQAIGVWLVLAARTGLMPEVNNEYLTVMQSSGLRDVARWFPELGLQVRAGVRSMSYAIIEVIRSAIYMVFRSEASPLLRFSEELDKMMSAKSAYMSQLHTLMAPYMYGQHEHGLMVMCRSMRLAYPFNYYKILRLLTARACRFKRRHFAQVYAAHGVELVDDAVATRMAEREDGTPPLFVQDLENFELLLDEEVDLQNAMAVTQTAQRLWGSPIFAPVQVGNGSQGTVDDETENGFGAVVGKHGPKRAKDIAKELPGMQWTDPNYLCINAMSINAMAEMALPEVQRVFDIDSNTLSTVLHHLSTIKLRVPVFCWVKGHRHENCPYDTLQFRRDGDQLAYQDEYIVREKRIGGINRVLINLPAMMIPPQMLMYHALSAAENMHTRPRETCLPLTVARHPDLLHPWSIKRRPVVLSLINPVTCTGPLQTRLDAAQPGSQQQERANSALAQMQIEYDRDPELCVYEKHMRNICMPPNYMDYLDELRNYGWQEAIERDGLDLRPGHTEPSHRQFEAVYTLWRDHHLARPGAADERANYLVANSKLLERTRPLTASNCAYPYAEILHTEIKTHVMDVLRDGAIEPMPKPPSHQTNGNGNVNGHHRHYQNGALTTFGRTHDPSSTEGRFAAAKDFLLALQTKMVSAQWLHSTMAMLDTREQRRRSVFVELFQSMALRSKARPGFAARELDLHHDTWHPVEALEPADDTELLLARQVVGLDELQRHHIDLLERLYELRRHVRLVVAAMIADNTSSVSRAQQQVLDNRRVAELHEVDAQLRLTRRFERRCLASNGAMQLDEEQTRTMHAYSTARSAVRMMRALIYHTLVACYVDRCKYSSKQISQASTFYATLLELPRTDVARKANRNAERRRHQQHQIADASHQLSSGRLFDDALRRCSAAVQLSASVASPARSELAAGVASMDIDGLSRRMFGSHDE